MADDGGVLGNLPNTRPGQRSEKRPAKRAKPKAKAKAPKAKAAPPPPPSPPPPPPPPAAESTDRGVGDVLTAAGKVAGAGIRIASGVAKEVIRRLPRP